MLHYLMTGEASSCKVEFKLIRIKKVLLFLRFMHLLLRFIIGHDRVPPLVLDVLMDTRWPQITQHKLCKMKQTLETC